jgi:hypothetical protein
MRVDCVSLRQWFFRAPAIVGRFPLSDARLDKGIVMAQGKAQR